MKQGLTFLIAAVFLLAAGGFLTSLFAGNSVTDVLPFLQQASDPEASTLTAESWQTEQLVLLIGFILFNMIGIGATIAAVIWFLSRGVTSVRAEAAKAE